MRSWGRCIFPSIATSRRRLIRFSIRHQSTAQDTLPSIAPKPCLDLKHIRSNPQLYADSCIARNYKSQEEVPFRIVDLHDALKFSQSQLYIRGIQQKSTAVEKQLTELTSANAGEQHAEKPTKETLLEEARSLKNKLAAIQKHEKPFIDEIEALAVLLPNLICDETPKSEPRVLGYINEHPNHPQPSLDDGRRDHVHIGQELDLIDFGGAARASGWGWYNLKNEGALLEQALIQYALKTALQYGFSVITPPSMVYSHIASSCGFHPRDANGEQQIYKIQQSDKDQTKSKPPHTLAGTAEIPFAGMNANQKIHADDLPIKIVGPSRCYRAEAGARGTDTKGLYRVHEFSKVEMFAWTIPGAETTQTFDAMLAVQREILSTLGLHCRILEMPATDLGASAFRKQDIETYFPSRRDKDDGWGEVTSASICTDYQTRRLNTRLKGGAQGQHFPYTVNGTALAVPRVLAALLENHWDEGGFVRIPEVLWPWMHGIKRIEKK